MVLGAVFRRCEECGVLLLFKKTISIEGALYCVGCSEHVFERNAQAIIDEKQEEQRKAKEKGDLRKRRAEERLKEELWKEGEEEREKKERKGKKSKPQILGPFSDAQPNRSDGRHGQADGDARGGSDVSSSVDSHLHGDDVITKEDVEGYNSILFIEADVKRLRVVEWIDGKKRVCLNKEREIRHTHKGGWSQEKFQKFVKAQKRDTFVWISDLLGRQGVLREKYDLVRVVCDDVTLKEKIVSFFEAEIEDTNFLGYYSLFR